VEPLDHLIPDWFDSPEINAEQFCAAIASTSRIRDAHVAFWAAVAELMQIV
jgi:hypothetical protein